MTVADVCDLRTYISRSLKLFGMHSWYQTITWRTYCVHMSDHQHCNCRRWFSGDQVAESKVQTTTKRYSPSPDREKSGRRTIDGLLMGSDRGRFELCSGDRRMRWQSARYGRYCYYYLFINVHGRQGFHSYR